MEQNTQASERSTGPLVWIVGLVVGAHMATAWLGRAIGLLVTEDDARYILLARALRDAAYHDLFTVGLPGHSLYPPGYPALLAVWGALFGEGFQTYIALNVLLSGAALWILFLALRKLVSTDLAALCIVALAANSLLIVRAGTVRSEIPFVFFLAVFAWAVAGDRISGRHLLVAAFAALAAGLTRSLGAALPLALMAHLLLERRYRALVTFGCVALLTVGAWQLWTFSAASDASASTNYVTAAVSGWEDPPEAGLFGTIVDRFRRNGTRYSHVLPGQMFPTLPGTPIDNAIGLLLWVGGLLAGGWFLMRRWRPAVLTIAIIAPVLGVWPYWHGRFLEPFLPLIVPCVVLGGGILAGRMRRSWRRPVMYALGAIVTVTGVVQTARELRARSDCDEFSLSNPPSCLAVDTQSFLRAVDYVNRFVPEDAIFVSAKAAPLYYYTERPSINYQVPRRASSSVDFAALLRDHGVGFVLLGSVHFTEPEALLSGLISACEELSVEAEFPPRTFVLRVLEDVEPDGARNACSSLGRYREANVDRDFGLGWPPPVR
jgi:hypothetical protein